MLHSRNKGAKRIYLRYHTAMKCVQYNRTNGIVNMTSIYLFQALRDEEKDAHTTTSITTLESLIPF